jgi:hypothetical protein
MLRLFDDLRRDLLQVRKATLTSMVARPAPASRFNENGVPTCL